MPNTDHSRYRPSPSRVATPESIHRVQAKPAVPVTADRFESEADTVADLVVRKLDEEPQHAETLRKAVPVEKAAPAKGAVTATAQTKKEEGAVKPNLPPVGVEVDSLAGGGATLSGVVRRLVEPVIGYDLSGVRIHTSGTAASLAKGIGARAFTVGANVAFAAGQFTVATKEGLHLLAHELTHVVQQGAAGARLAEAMGPSISRLGAVGEPIFQRLSGGEAKESDGVIDWIIEKIGTGLRNIPGWDLATWLLGFDPLTGKDVPRTAAVLVKGIVGMAPFGALLYEKLEQSGLAQKAMSWIEENLEKRQLNRARIAKVFQEVKDAVGITDLLSPTKVFEEHLAPIFNEASAFALNAADEAATLLRETLVTPLRESFGENSRVYQLLTVILGKDPITGAEVARSPEAILTGLLMLTESGKAYLEQLQASGTLKKMRSWLDVHLAELKLNEEEIRKTIRAIWDTLDAKAILQPTQTFERIWQIVEAPVGRIVTFVRAVATEVLSVVKDWALGKLQAMAADVPGYPLVCVILEKDPFTQEVVPRTAENFIKGFMSLVPGGLQKYEELAKAGTIDKALEWLGQAVARLGLSWKEISGLFRQAWDSLSIIDLAKPEAAFNRILNLFAGPVARIVTFAGEVGLKVVELIIAGVMGTAGERVMSLLTRSKKAFNIILQDPIAFAQNLMAAVRGGFDKFSNNILDHLKAGLFGWLMGALEGAGITMPEKLDLKGLVSLALQILGITYPRIRARLVEHLGEGLVSKLETVFEFVQGLVTEGPAFLWDKIVEYVGNIEETIIGGIKDFVVTKVVTAAITKIVSMLNPVGAIVQAALSVYNTVMFFVERIEQIATLVESIVESITNIAEGKLDDAINYVEAAMGRSVPVIISFLARLIGLGNVSESIKKVIDKLQAGVDIAIGKVIGFIVEKAKALFAKVKAGVGKIAAWWKQEEPFTDESGEHHIYVSGESEPGEIMVQSTPETLKAFLQKSKFGADKKVAIEKIADRIDDLRGDNDGKSESFTKTAGAEIAALLKQIGKLLEGTSGERPPSEVREKSLRSGSLHKLDGDGQMIRVSPLSAQPGGLVGSKPYAESPLWRAVRVREDEYVRGHLLNHNVHGPGEAWNLTPIPKKTNSQMEAGFESELKRLVIGENQVVDLTVVVTYKNGEHGSRILEAEEDMATNIDMHALKMKRKPGGSGKEASDWESTKEDAIASKSFPIKLPVNTGSGKIRVSKLNLSNFRGGNLPTRMRVSEMRELAIKRLDEIGQIGEPRAKAILDAKPTSMKELEAVPNLNKDALAALRDAIKREELTLEGPDVFSDYLVPEKD